jgi:hypothetical protein
MPRHVAPSFGDERAPLALTIAGATQRSQAALRLKDIPVFHAQRVRTHKRVSSIYGQGKRYFTWGRWHGVGRALAERWKCYFGLRRVNF